MRYDLVYDHKDWKFDAEAPVRAAPLIAGNNIYFGNARADFFSLKLW